MSTIETNNPHTTDNIIHREESILTGATPPKNLLEQQMLLAEQLYREAHAGEEINIHDGNTRNKIMETWSSPTSKGQESYSGAFRKLISHSEFIKHPRLKRDPMRVTLDDVRFYILNQSLPLE